MDCKREENICINLQRNRLNSMQCHKDHSVEFEEETDVAPLLSALLTSSLSFISPLAIIGLHVAPAILAVTFGIVPGKISIASAQSNGICFYMLTRAIESKTKKR